ncbi:MMPL family transporter [Streptomyces goshikiensis]|uniref:MMPL family transporter n=1 Tax=Streptomyces goshikiensis TaxID=1942 RepID=UPI00167AAB77|nr:MMPL family transporter [Streptomyces goshikiensis]GHD82563.1 putative membrane protein [Streptomyces goshikiensis]
MVKNFNRAWSVPLLALWLLLALVTSPFTVRLGEAAHASSNLQLPGEAESARVDRLLNPTGADQPLPLAVIWLSRTEGEQITSRQFETARQVSAGFSGVGASGVPVLSREGRALTAVIAAGPTGLPAQLAAVREAAAAVGGTSVYLAGAAAAQADLDGAFAATDGALLAFALGGVLLILLLVYRSVLMPLLVMVGALVALAVSCAALYALVRAGILQIDGQSQGIVFVLVVGASTDYALLLAARYREELSEQHDTARAMAPAVRATTPPVLASAATIACAMLTLLFSALPSERALGPAVMIAMVCCAAVSLTFLPAALTLCHRHTLRPHAGAGPHRGWARPTRTVEHRPRRVWLACLTLLAAGAVAAPLLTQSGIPLHQALPAKASSAVGQRVLARHFPAGTASPLVIVAPTARASEARSRVAATAGVAAVSAPPARPGGTALVLATLTDAPDSAQARQTVARLRASLAGTSALVGGQSAQLADLHEASRRSHRLIMPLVLAVVLAVLIVLLRCLLLPLLLVATAWVSLFTAFGTAAVTFRMVFGSAATEPAVVLFSFVFLVALGVDYNIFLVHRIRGEAVVRGTTAGVRQGLATTSGVISAAGLILATTFASLAVMPLLYLAQIGCIVAIGVLIDTLLVRLFLVPALILDLGHHTWWPARLPGDRLTADSTLVPAPPVGSHASPSPSRAAP